MGTRQSGMPLLRVGNLIRDLKILELARLEAFALIEKDPNLEAPGHANLRQRLQRALGKYMNLVKII